MLLTADFVVLGGMPVVAHEYHDGILRQAVGLKPVHDNSHSIVRCGNYLCVRLTGHLHIFIAIVKLLVGLFGVVRDIERDVHEERDILVLIDEPHRPLGHHIGEVFPLGEDLLLALVEIVEAVAMQEVVIVVVNEAAPVPEVFIEALFRGRRPRCVEEATGNERGHDRDLSDVHEMLARGLIESERVLDLFAQIEPELYRYPAIDPPSFRRRVERFLAPD